MKKNQLTKSLMAAFMLTSGAAMAGADYPAADFQPKVLYTNPDYKESAAAPVSAAKSAPVAKAAAVEVEADPNFPAASFQPKVLYSNADYKHSSAAPAAVGASSSAKPTAAAAAVEVIQSEKEGSSDLSIVGLLALAVVGFLLFNKKSSGSTAGTAASDSYSQSGDATGVEKYLEKIGANKTGVAKYLEKQGTTTTTGVARYMAKQVVKDREAAAARATGVEKYLRDKV